MEGEAAAGLTRGTGECVVYGCKSSRFPPLHFSLTTLSCTLSLCLSAGHEVVKPKISAVRSSQHIHQKRNCAPFPFHLFTRASRVSRVTDRERMLLLRLKSLGVACVIRNTFLSVCYLQSSLHHKTKRGIKGIRSLQSSGAV